MRAAFIAANAQPCNCRGTEHEFTCAAGGAIFRSNIDLIGWILGEAGEKTESLLKMILDNNRKPL